VESTPLRLRVGYQAHTPADPNASDDLRKKFRENFNSRIHKLASNEHLSQSDTSDGDMFDFDVMRQINVSITELIHRNPDPALPMLNLIIGPTPKELKFFFRQNFRFWTVYGFQ
jgi:hypothetical protein